MAEATGLWKASGLKVRGFCAHEDVSPTAFAHWRKEIASRDARRAEAADPLFVPLHITPYPNPLEVALPGARVARVPRGFEPAHLRAVVTALEGSPC